VATVACIVPVRVATTTGSAQKERVRSFWEDEPCGSVHSDAPEGTREFFDEIERHRYRVEPDIIPFADFEGAKGKRVLEIGVGLGTDFIRFARAGAVATGVDLTQHGVDLVQKRLELEGLEAEVKVADAESLPFDDATFDRVYSWGVLHHTPDTEKAVREAVRVLRPGGEAFVMLYSRHSWVTYALWTRYGLLRGRPWRSLAEILANHMESEGTRGFTKGELRGMFDGLTELRIEKLGTPYDRKVAGPLAAVTGGSLGWWLTIRGRKPAAG
jgi:SAM-dependent methyltransferase